jgi:hypothetical protein
MTDRLEYPYGLAIDNGRYRLDSLLRGIPHEGLWRASRTSDEPGTVLVTLRRLRWSRELDALLRYSAPGVPSPLFIGPPDRFDADGEVVRHEHTCVVDEQPPGLDLASIGRLNLDETLELGTSLCDVILAWAASHGGVITRGLRPETIFMTGTAGQRTYSGATPRPFFLLGNDDTRPPYPRLSFDPPAPSNFEFSAADALFTVSMILWYSFTCVHPYVIAGTNVDQNVWSDRRVPFMGPEALGSILQAALVADVENRISVEAFRARLADLRSAKS